MVQTVFRLNKVYINVIQNTENKFQLTQCSDTVYSQLLAVKMCGHRILHPHNK